MILAGASSLAAAERSRALQLHAGVFNVGKTPTQAEFGVELRTPTPWWKLDIAGGATVTEEGSFWAYVGGRVDFEAGKKFVIAPGLGIAFYEEGDGKDLGGSLQFRSAIDFGYRITKKARLGLTFYHLSNAGIEEFNPGANSAVLTYSVNLK